MATLHPSQLAGFNAQVIQKVVTAPCIVEPPYVPTVAEAQIIACNNIDQAAGKIRLRYITSAPGQTEIYLEKTEEAIDYTVAGYPDDATSYPFIVAEANASKISYQDAAKLIIQKKGQWIVKAAAIDEVRRSGKLTINQLQDIVEINRVAESTIELLNTL